MSTESEAQYPPGICERRLSNLSNAESFLAGHRQNQEKQGKRRRIEPVETGEDESTQCRYDRTHRNRKGNRFDEALWFNTSHTQQPLTPAVRNNGQP